MATVASLHEEDYGPGMQIFVASLRIIGAALTAAFTAIVTNYLLRARLGGALEASRVPESGHVLVCGLGPIGLRVVEELVAYKAPVVVIELAADNRFVAAVRRLKVPVIIGDAAVEGILRQANAPNARAVVATTSKDLINIEIALLVRALNSTQRVVLLLSDQQMAQMLRDEAHVRLAVSVPALARLLSWPASTATGCRASFLSAAACWPRSTCSSSRKTPWSTNLSGPWRSTTKWCQSPCSRPTAPPTTSY